MSIPTHQKALFIKAKQGDWEVSDTEIPKPGGGQLLVKVEAAALNPVDWKIQARGIFVTQYPAVIGIDSAGVVAAIGEGVSGFAIGDRVLHLATLSPDNTLAAYQQYVIINPAEIASKIPVNISFDQAATVPLGLTTAAAALFGPQWASGGAGYAAPWEEGNRGKYSNEPIVIIGGSSSIGQFAIQLAKLAGFSPIITTVSPHNIDFVKSLGATHAVDRTLDGGAIVGAVRNITAIPIKIVLDSISVASTQDVAYDILSPGGQLVLTTAPLIDQSKVTPEKKFWQVFGSVHVPQHKEFGISLFGHLEKLLESGEIKPNPVEYASGGLHSVSVQLERLKKGDISARKIVVRPPETA